MSSNTSGILPRLLFTILLAVTAMAVVNAQQATEATMAPRSTAGLPNLTVLLLLPGQETTGKSADGLSAYFSKDFDNAVGEEDAYKFSNPDENIGILRNGTLLSIEGRKPVINVDTLPLKIWKLSRKSYSLRVDLSNLPGVMGYVHDSYLKSDIKLEINTKTLVPFTITTDAASLASDRFSVVLRSFSTLTVQLTGIKASEKNKRVEVAWTSENESNINRYEVQKSTNGYDFATAGSVSPKNIQGISAAYAWYDGNATNGNIYYRIKSFDNSGDAKYSPVTKVQLTNAIGKISVSTNPADGNTILLSLVNSNKGNYYVNLVSLTGQSFYKGNISHYGGSVSQVLRINQFLPAGLYQMVVAHENKKENFALFIR